MTWPRASPPGDNDVGLCADEAPRALALLTRSGEFPGVARLRGRLYGEFNSSAPKRHHRYQHTPTLEAAGPAGLRRRAQVQIIISK